MLVTWQTNILNYYSDMFAEYNTQFNCQHSEF